MKSVINAIEKIKTISGSQVDTNYLQGLHVFTSYVSHLNEEGLVFPPLDNPDKLIEYGQSIFQEILFWMQPYRAPRDYLFFLQYYGGLQLSLSDRFLDLFGIGIMTENWYSGLRGDEQIASPSKDGLLQICDVRMHISPLEYYWVAFFLDLSGAIRIGSVFGISSKNLTGVNYRYVLDHLDEMKEHWKFHANSFTEWLNILYETRGSFGYQHL